MFFQEKRDAMRLLTALEDGRVSVEDTRPLAEEADPALVYLIFGWLRARYHAGHSASAGVLGRIVELCRESHEVARLVKVGEKDSISRWFEETHEYQEFDRDAFIGLIVEKLES